MCQRARIGTWIAINHNADTHVAAYAMTVLLPDVEEAQRLAAALDDVRRPDGPLAVIAVPPVRGLAFFADADRQGKIDRWWAHVIPQNTVPVHLVQHEAGVAEWLPGLDGRFVVGVGSPEDAQLYGGMRNVTVAPGDALLDIALTVVDQFAFEPVFREDAAMRLDKRLRRSQTDPGSRFRRARLRPSDEVFPGSLPPPAPGHHPIPNVPPLEGASILSEDARPEDLVRALAETLRRLQRIRSSS
ncbi:MAG: hypothetical protein ABI352_00060 [Candidatus Dormibacter sp.]